MMPLASCDTGGINNGITALCWLQCQILPMALSIAPLHSLDQEDQNEVQHDLLVMGHHWCWHQQQMMLTALSMAPLHSLG